MSESVWMVLVNVLLSVPVWCCAVPRECLGAARGESGAVLRGKLAESLGCSCGCALFFLFRKRLGHTGSA